jgi:hypothetical protein
MPWRGSASSDAAAERPESPAQKASQVRVREKVSFRISETIPGFPHVLFETYAGRAWHFKLLAWPSAETGL